MGQQQLMLIVLVVILVSIAVAVGVTIFKSIAEQSSVDAILNDLQTLSTHVIRYRLIPASMGGGGGSFNGVENIETLFEINSNAEYANYVFDPEETGEDVVKISGTSLSESDLTISIFVYDDGTTSAPIYERSNIASGGGCAE